MHNETHMRTFAQDLRYGFRLFVQNPGFTTVALLTLTLGIGATAAIFSVVDAVLVRSLPYRDPGRLVRVYEDAEREGFPFNTPAPGNYQDWKAQTQIFQDVAALAPGVYNLTSDREPLELIGMAASQNLFSLLGVSPSLGRTFLPEEDQAGGRRVAVLAHSLWVSQFGGDRKAIGQEILLNKEKYTIIGVMPPGFSFPYASVSLWTPLALPRDKAVTRSSHFLEVVARLQPGVTIEKSNAELRVLARRLAREFPDTNAGIERFFTEPLQSSYTRDVRRGLIVLLTAVGFILLIACANIANLLLSRASARQREIAVRTALGASRMRVIRQLLTESGLLAITAGALGILLADWCFLFLKNLIPTDLAQNAALTLDFRLLSFAVFISLASSFLFGLAPALQVSKLDLNEVLKEGARGSAGGRRKLFRNLLVIGEVALSMMLLVGSGLLLESFARLRGLDPGFRADHVLTMNLQASNGDAEHFNDRSRFFQAVLDKLAALPGVKTAGITSALPLTWDGGTSGFTPEGMPMRPEISYDANNRVVTPGYFEAMRIPLRRGRLFDARDGLNSPPVVIINETMAKTFWPNQDPVGRRFQPGFGPESPWCRIVGVVADVRQMALNQPPRQEMYFPMWQSKLNWMIPRDLVIRTAGDPLSLANDVSKAIWSIDRNQPISKVMTLDQLLDNQLTQRRVQTTLLGALAALAMILACVGIYGVLSYLVVQRTREIGVRLALGASASAIMRDVAGQGLSLTAIGIAAGIFAAMLLSRLLATLLFEVKPTDPLTYLAATALFAVVGLISCYVPTRRAMKVDPMVALRYE